MADLVPQHPGHFRLVVEIGQDAPGEVNKAPGNGKSVDHRGVQHPELVIQLRAVRNGRHLFSLSSDKLADFRVVIETVSSDHLGIGLLPQLNLIRIGEQHKFPLPGDRIDGTGYDPDQHT